LYHSLSRTQQKESLTIAKLLTKKDLANCDVRPRQSPHLAYKVVIMLFTNISGPGPLDAPANSTPLEMLQGCHVRIRHFMQLSRTLAQATDASQNDIADAAASLTRYFSEALPLHEADENQTLFPRLYDAAPLGSPLREAAKTMVEQHRIIDELVTELLSLCGAIHRQPELLPSLASRLKQVTSALDEVFTSHLHMEETVIFPALQLFPPALLKEISNEMQQRRRPPREGIHLVR
jgi:hemerythrin-like domain-containing protein